MAKIVGTAAREVPGVHSLGNGPDAGDGVNVVVPGAAGAAAPHVVQVYRE
ncbi:hypothetical protein [Kitasatospora sp. NPDC059571]